MSIGNSRTTIPSPAERFISFRFRTCHPHRASWRPMSLLAVSSGVIELLDSDCPRLRSFGETSWAARRRLRPADPGSLPCGTVTDHIRPLAGLVWVAWHARRDLARRHNQRSRRLGPQVDLKSLMQRPWPFPSRVDPVRRMWPTLPRLQVQPPQPRRTYTAGLNSPSMMSQRPGIS